MSNVPEVGSVWRHRNGAEYRVIHLANFYSSDVRYPLTVVYQGVVNGKVWSRPMDQWHRSMTLIEKANQPATGEPIQVEAVAVTRARKDGGLALEWLIEGGIFALEAPGVVLLVAHGTVTDDQGSGEVYLAPPAAAHGDEAVRAPEASAQDLANLNNFFMAVVLDSGHTVDKEGLRSLAELGALENCGFGKHRLTRFGQYLMDCDAAMRAQGDGEVQ